MLRSMTGYGRGEARTKKLTIVVELKSVNNRFRDVNLRAPREYLALEPRMSALLKEPFARGRIDAYVRRNAAASSFTVTADLELARQYARVVRGLREALDPDGPAALPLDFILSQSNVIQTSEAHIDVMEEWDVVEIALQAAITDLLEMREREGTAIREDLEQLLSKFRTLVAEVEAASINVSERVQQRLTKRLAKLSHDVDPQRVAQEVAFIADKADINEEVKRLFSHCSQFRDTLDEDEPVGRRLDFLLQEMHREVNTLGSKSTEGQVSQRVVRMKSLLERMREQSANIE